MRPAARTALCLLLLACPAAAKGGKRPDLSGAGRWAAFYGKNLSLQAWDSLDLAITDPDTFALPKSTGPVSVAYISVGEADEHRSFWPEVRGQPFVIEPNPEWPGAHRVDMRAEQWRGLLLRQVIPAALKRGYQGVMLDTIDVAQYFESSAPARFAGSMQAAVDFVQELRRRHPETAILINNGLPLLERLGETIDGVLVEDLYTRCLPAAERCAPTPEAVALAKEKLLKDFTVRTGRPVFVVLYAQLSERGSKWLRGAVRRSRRMGFKPYVASPSLQRLGVIEPNADK
ncbi:MAG: endo alpha-1,4 polygalactosaminidase [Elusimicrobiota bacterium]